MLAGRLVAIARDILEDYRRFGVVDLLTRAQNLAAQKGNIQDQQYLAQAIALRDKAKSIRNNTRISLYPEDLKNRIFSSDFSQVTPERAAQIVLSGISENKNAGMASSELAIYVNNANLLVSELSSVINAGNKLGIESIQIPDDTISLDVEIPRVSVENQTGRLFNFYLRFSNVMTSFSELATGGNVSPELCYTSTTDPVTGFALIFSAASGFLVFYKQLLEVAEKHIGIHKTLKDLRQSGISTTEEMENQLNAMVDKKFNEAIETAINQMVIKVDDGRKLEISNAIRKDGKHVLEAVANGATVSVTVEALDRLPLLVEATPNSTIESFQIDAHERKNLEYRIKNSLLSFGEKAPALLENQGSGKSRA